MTESAKRGEWGYFHTRKKSKIEKTRFRCHNMLMNTPPSEKQLDYLADLAYDKNVRINVDGRDSDWVSAKIEELKHMPDREFAEATPEMDEKLRADVQKIKDNISKWTFPT